MRYSFVEAIEGPYTEGYHSILDQLPQNERGLWRQYLKNPALSGPHPSAIVGVTVKHATPRRVYRIFLNGKLVGYMDYRQDIVKKWSPQSWDEPRDEDMTRKDKNDLLATIIKLKR